MWTCPKCNETVEDDFCVCWNCGTAQDGSLDPEFHQVDTETAQVLSARATAASEAESSDNDIDETGVIFKGMFFAIRFLSFACCLAAVIKAIQFWIVFHTYIKRFDPFRPPLADFFPQISIQEIMELASVAFVIAFVGFSYFLWKYSLTLRNLINAKQINSENLIEAQRKMWKGAAVATIIALLTGLMISFSLVVYGK
jgi:hypothetical protein